MADVLTVIGAGGIGMAIAHRMGAGTTIVLADVSPDVLRAGEAALVGHDVRTIEVDVASSSSVSALAAFAADQGTVRCVAHTAGVSPVQASVERIRQVDLLGVVHVLEAFGAVIAPGGAAVVISSAAGHMQAPLPVDDQIALASRPAAELDGLEVLHSEQATASGLAAYSIAKYANHLRVRAASLTWGARGARVNSISPGVIASEMSSQELEGDNGEMMRRMIETSPAGRLGTVEEIAEAAAFLLGDGARFITGTDLLVDGGTMAVIKEAGLG